MKLATSSLACSWGLPRPIKNPTQKKSGCCPGLGQLPKIWRFPFNIYAMAEASDFKFGTQLGFPTSSYKITLKDKNGPGPRLEAPKKLKQPFGTLLGFAC